jgi:hypothetical protein
VCRNTPLGPWPDNALLQGELTPGWPVNCLRKRNAGHVELARRKERCAVTRDRRGSTLREALRSFTRARSRERAMANNEDNFPKTIAEPGALPGSLEHETPVTGGQSETAAELELTATQAPLPEVPGPAALQSSLHDRAEFSAAEPGEPPEPAQSSPVYREAMPEAASPQPALTDAESKPRSLFPALAATAIIGAILGLGGSFALRYFEGSRPGAVVSDERVTALSARIDSIEGKEDAASAAARSTLASLETRVAAAESAASKAVELANSAAEEAQKAAAAKPAAQEPASSSAPAEAPDLGPLEARISAIEQKLAPLESELATPKASMRAEQDRENAAGMQVSRAQAVAVVAENLLRKLDSGEQFSPELGMLENLGVPQAALAPLRAVSESGISSKRQLTALFASFAPKIIASESAKPTGEEESFVDRLTRNAKGLVHVHRVGDAEAADVRGIVARIEHALSDHDLETAYNAWNQLPNAAISASQGWGEAAKAWLDALNAARAIAADAVAVLGKPKS